MPAGDGAGQTEHTEQADPRRWKALAVTLVAGFMGLLDVSIVNVALPSIQHGLGGSAQSVQWVISGYALAFGLVLVAGGRLGDVLGRRRMFVLALIGFVLASVAAGAAPAVWALVVARLVQGLAAGMLTPQNSGLIQDLFRGAERGRAFGMLGATIGVSTAAGPVVGGVILAAFGPDAGWRWVFFVNVPVGIVALVLTMRFVPAGRRSTGRVRDQIDRVGMALLGLAVLAVMLPVVQAQGGGEPLLWALLVPAAVLGALFVRWETRLVRADRVPLLDLRLFTRTAGFPTGLLVGTVYFLGFSGIWLVLSLFFQDGLGYSPLRSGLAVTPFAVASSVSAMIAGRLVARYGRRLTVGGLSLVAAGLGSAAAILLVHGGGAAGQWLIVPLLVAGVGGGAVVSPNTTLTLACVPTRMAGAAGGALQTGQRIGTAIGTAVLATVFRASASGGQVPRAAAFALACTVGFVLLALVVAVVDLRRSTEPDGEAAPSVG